ncbi:hypothetical protein [Halovenus salina]|uniref:Uncharacterized protein n=1 Tax=Halovenus salina TaxID=1510225 RepID=A0ABD5W2J2_9EURY|nr:hypothetical protein [Halovenus salina]
MPKKALLILGLLMFMFLFGYPGGEPQPSIAERINASDGPCHRDTTKGDPKPTYCWLEKKPPDIDVRNSHHESHNVTVQIVQDSTVIYSANDSLESASGGVVNHRLEDVVNEPGNYTIRATLDGQQTDSYTDSVEKIYMGDGGPKWWVRIDEVGTLHVNSIPSM